MISSEGEKKGGRQGSSLAPNFLKELFFTIGGCASERDFTDSLGSRNWGKQCIRERLYRGIANSNWN